MYAPKKQSPKIYEVKIDRIEGRTLQFRNML